MISLATFKEERDAHLGIERVIDEAIRSAARVGLTTVEVMYRRGWPRDEVDAKLALYKLSGWSCTIEINGRSNTPTKIVLKAT